MAAKVIYLIIPALSYFNTQSQISGQQMLLSSSVRRVVLLHHWGKLSGEISEYVLRNK